MAPATLGLAAGSRNPARASVLIVDDEELTRHALCRLLEHGGYSCAPAADAREARTMLARGGFALALCDLVLPGESGLELLRHLLVEHPDVAPLVISGCDEPEFAEHAFRLGAHGYLVKPFTPNELLAGVSDALTAHKRVAERRGGFDRNGEQLPGVLAQLELLGARSRASLEEAISCLARAVELREGVADAHSERVGSYCDLLARGLALGHEEAERIRVASLLHDIGKLAVPDEILLKGGPLTPREWAIMHEHPELGRRILAGTTDRVLRLGAMIAYTHHERFDGSGYPRSLAGGEIPLAGRIVAVADVFDALTSERPYRAALPTGEAAEMIASARGRQFDPAAVDVFVERFDEVLAIKERHAGDGGPTERAELPIGSGQR